MIFPYIDDEPVVPLEIKNKQGKWVLFHGYLDSGAGYSVFHPDVAEIVGLDIYKGEEIFLTVGDGAKIDCYIHKLPVKFAGKDFIASIGFSPSLGIGTNIIGLHSFFDRFKVCFSNKRKRLEIKQI